MISPPKIAVVYVYAGYRDKAAQFVSSYQNNPPGAAHETVIVCNGIPANGDTRALFSPLPSCSFIDRDNSGWDIGAYQAAAQTVDCDLMLFCGSHTYFRKPGWIRRMLEVWDMHGTALYGATGSQGNGGGVHPHIRTTAFWCPPKLMNWYPYRVMQPGSGGQRYEMEHGQTCFSNWVKQEGLKRLVVGWTEVWPLENCDSMTNGFHRGDQSNVLIGDRLTMAPFWDHP